MKLIFFFAALIATVSALTHNVAEVEQIEVNSPKKCALQLQAALNYPETPAANYLGQIAQRFRCSSQVLYTPNNVSYIENFERTYGVIVVVHDAFGVPLFPDSSSPIYPLLTPTMGVPIYPAEINNPIVAYFPGHLAYDTTFLVYSAFGEVKIVSIGLPAVNSPFF